MRRNTLKNYGFVKPKSRFNLLLLEPSEQYLNDCACEYFNTTRQRFDSIFLIKGSGINERSIERCWEQ